MESDGRLSQSHALGQPGQVLGRVPSLVGASKLQFVAIGAGLLQPEDGCDLWQLHMADARQLVIDLLLLGLQLLLVGQGLPFAAATDAEVGTHRLRPDVTLLDKSLDGSLTIAAPLLAHAQVHDVARDDKGDEDHHLAHMGDAFTLGGNGLYGDVFQQG